MPLTRYLAHYNLYYRISAIITFFGILFLVVSISIVSLPIYPILLTVILVITGISAFLNRKLWKWIDTVIKTKYGIQDSEIFVDEKFRSFICRVIAYLGSSYYLSYLFSLYYLILLSLVMMSKFQLIPSRIILTENFSVNIGVAIIIISLPIIILMMKYLTQESSKKIARVLSETTKEHISIIESSLDIGALNTSIKDHLKNIFRTLLEINILTAIRDTVSLNKIQQYYDIIGSRIDEIVKKTESDLSSIMSQKLDNIERSLLKNERSLVALTIYSDIVNSMKKNYKKFINEMIGQKKRSSEIDNILRSLETDVISCATLTDIGEKIRKRQAILEGQIKMLEYNLRELVKKRAYEVYLFNPNYQDVFSIIRRLSIQMLKSLYLKSFIRG